MDRSSLIVVVMPITTLIVLFTGVTLPFIAARRKVRPPEPGAHDAAPAGYLYVPCVRIGYRGSPAGTRCWVQEVPIVRKTATLIYYASDSWDRSEAVVSPGCISREHFETNRHGYPAGVIPIPGHRHGPAGRLFFATREAAEYDLYRGKNNRAERAGSDAPPIRELRRAMADAHPDRGGSAERFIEARRRYETALQGR